jgi:thioredoxin-related protein
MKSLLSFIFLINIGFNSIDWTIDFEKAKTDAAQQNKYILLNFSGSDWCAPCIKLKREIFESAEFTQMAAEHLVMLKADFPRLKKNQLSETQTTHNEALAEKYNPEGKFPFTVLLDATGKKVRVWDGYPKGLTSAQMANEIKKSMGR